MFIIAHIFDEHIKEIIENNATKQIIKYKGELEVDIKGKKNSFLTTSVQDHCMASARIRSTNSTVR